MSAASGGNSEPKQGQRSQSARGFCPRSTMRVPQPDIIEHFGNADAVPQPPERCLSRQAGIVRCCPKNSSARKLLKRPAIPSGCMNKIFFHISHLSLRTFANNQKVPIPQRHVIRRMWGGHFLFCDFIGARYFHRSGIKFSCRRCPRLGNHYLMNRLSRSSPLPWAHIRQGKQDCLRGLLIATCLLGRHHRYVPKSAYCLHPQVSY